MVPMKCEHCDGVALYVVRKGNPRDLVPKESIYLCDRCVRMLPKEDRKNAIPFLS